MQGVNLGTVKSRLVRGRACLKVLLTAPSRTETHPIRRGPRFAFGRGGAMNGCTALQAKFSEYLDGRLTGHEMQRISAHLDRCPACAREWAALRENQSVAVCAGAGARAGRPGTAHSRGREPGARPPQSQRWPECSWRGETPWGRSFCRPRPDSPAPCCCWARSPSWWACLPSLKRPRPPTMSRWAMPPRRACSIFLGGADGATTSTPLRAGGRRGLHQRRGPGLRLSHRLRARRRNHARPGRELLLVQPV